MNEIERVARALAKRNYPSASDADIAEMAEGFTADATAAIAAMRGEPVRKYTLGDRLTKTKGSAWTGRVVGFYSTSLTPVGYAIESENEPGSVQIYPEKFLREAD
jgi:hypothetical protein